MFKSIKPIDQARWLEIHHLKSTMPLVLTVARLRWIHLHMFGQRPRRKRLQHPAKSSGTLSMVAGCVLQSSRSLHPNQRKTFNATCLTGMAVHLVAAGYQSRQYQSSPRILSTALVDAVTVLWRKHHLLHRSVTIAVARLVEPLAAVIGMTHHHHRFLRRERMHLRKLLHRHRPLPLAQVALSVA